MTQEIDQRDIPNDASCLDCGYALRGLPRTVCPECGRAFVCDDPSTYQLPKQHLSWLTRELARPPSLLTIILLVTIALRDLYLASMPNAEALEGRLDLLRPLILSALFGEYCLRIIAYKDDSIRRLQDRAQVRHRRRWRWGALPLCIVFICLTVIQHWPMKVRFWMSRSAFEQMQARVEAGETEPEGYVWVGLYKVGIDYNDGKACFRTKGGGWRNTPYGFARLASIRPEFSPIEHVIGDWYVISFTGY